MILLAQDDACCSKKYVDFSQKTPQLFKQKTYLHGELEFTLPGNQLGVQGTNMWIEQATFWN